MMYHKYYIIVYQVIKLKSNKIFFISILIILLLAITSASASENITSEDISKDTNSFDNVEIRCDADSKIEYGRNVTFTAKNLPNDFDGTFVVSEFEDGEASVPGPGSGREVGRSPVVNTQSKIILTDLAFGGHYYYSEIFNNANNSIKHSRLGFDVVPYINGQLSPCEDLEFKPLIGNATVIVELPKDANGTGKFIEYSTNSSQEINLTEGKAELYISNLTFGQYDYIFSYNDGKYNIYQTVAVLQVSPKITYPEFMMIGDDEYLTFEAPSDANGTLYVLNTIKTLENGKANVSLSNLPLGLTYLNLSYFDEKYGNYSLDKYLGVRVCNMTAKLEITRITDKIIITLNESVPYALGEIIIDNVTSALFFDNSTAEIPYDDFENITARFLGSAHCIPVSVSKRNPFRLSPEQMEYDVGDVEIQAAVRGNVTGDLQIMGENVGNYTFPITQSIMKMPIPNLPAGKYNITISYAGNDEFFASSYSRTILVMENLPPFIFNPKIIAKDTTVKYLSKAKITAKVYMSDDMIVAGDILVTFKVNGKKYITVNTTSKGEATVTLNKAPGTYEITIEAMGIKEIRKLTVKHLVTLKTAAVKKSAKKLTLKVTLAKVNGKYLKNKKVTFKFNGKKYAAKTNSKGVAKVTIKSQVLKKLKVSKKVTYQTTYLKDTIKKTSKIKK